MEQNVLAQMGAAEEQDKKTRAFLQTGQFKKNLDDLGKATEQRNLAMQDQRTALPILRDEQKVRDEHEALVEKENKRIKDEFEAPYRKDGFWGGVKLGSKYLTSKILEGGAKIGTGAMSAADMVRRDVLGGTDENAQSDVNKQIIDAARLGVPAEYQGNDAVSGAIGNIATMVPAILGAAPTGGATFFLQGVGNADEEVSRLKDSGVKFENGADDIYKVMSGITNYGLMTALNSHTLFSKFPAAARNRIISKASVDGLNNLMKSGEPITAQSITEAGMASAKTVADNLPEYLKSVGKGYALTSADLAAFNVVDALNKEAANKISGNEVFTQTPDEMLKNIGHALMVDAPLFALGGAVRSRGMLFDKSPLKNDIIESLKEDTSPENVARIKEAITNQSNEWTTAPEQVEASVATVDKLSEAVNKLPKGLIPPTNFNEAVDLVMGRNELQEEAKAMAEQRGQMDEAVQDVVSEQEQLVLDKIDQANDKLKDLATGKRTTYSKGVGEEEGKFFKTTDGKKEEISPSRYELENIEREAKAAEPDPIVAEETAPVAEENKEQAVTEQPTVVPNEQAVENTQAELPVPESKVKSKSAVQEVLSETVSEDGVGETKEALETSVDYFKVDDTGTFYHASPNKREGRLKEGTAPQFGKGVYFSTNKDLVIDEFGNELTEVKLKTAKPLYTGTKEENAVKEKAAENWNKQNLTWDKENEYWIDKNGKETLPVEFSDLGERLPVSYYSDAAKELGYDVIVDKGSSTYDNEIVVLDESKIEYPEDVKETAKPVNKPVQATKPTETTKTTTQVKEAPVEPKKASDKAKDIAARIRALKTDKNKLYGGVQGVAVAVYDGALETVATAIEAGGALADAVQAGIKYIKDNSEVKDEKLIREGLAKDLSDIGIEVTGIKHADTAKQREAAGMGEYEKITKTEAELNAQADKAMEGGYDINKLITKLEKGDLPTDVENTILKKFVASLTAAIDDAPTTELVAQRKRLIDVLESSGTELGRALASRRGAIVKENNLANFISDEMQAFGVDELPQATVNKLKSEWDTGEAARKAYEEGYKKAQEEAAKEKAEKSLQRMRKSVKGTKKSHDDFVKERQDIIKQLRADLLKVAKGGSGAMSSIPGAAQLAAIAPHVAKLVKSLAEEGYTKLEDIVKMVHDDIKDAVDDISLADVRDIIAGEYREAKPTRNEITAQLRDIQLQAKLLKKIEDLQNRVEPKTEPNRIARSKEVQELQRQVKEIEDRYRQEERDAQEPREVTDEQYLKTKQTYLKNQIAKLKKAIDEGDYDLEDQVPRNIKLDPETQRYQDEYIKFQKQYRERRDKARYDQLPTWEKGWDKVMQALGLRRLVQTALDFSMPFRQAITVTLNPRHVKITAKAFGNMFKGTFNEKNYDRIMFNMENTPEYKEMIADKLKFNDVESKDNLNRDEEFRTSFIYKIPYLREPLMASNRAAAGFINTARFELYMKGKKNLERQGITRENSPKDYTELAKWAMNVTGRGNLLDFLENSPSGQRVMGNTFYGARLMASRFNLLNPNYYRKMPKAMRMEAMKDMASFASTALVTALALQAAGATVSTDPDEADFMKARFGNKRYDITGGLSQYIRTYMRIAKAIYMRANPDIRKKDADKYGKFALMSTTNFFRYKLAPNTGYAISGLTGKDPVNQDFNPYDIAKIYPMYVDDMVEAWEDDGAMTGLTILLPSVFGVGVQNYDDKK